MTPNSPSPQAVSLTGRLAPRPWMPGDDLPEVGSQVLVSGVHADVESDQHRAYLWRNVVGYGEGDKFICLQTTGCWPTVERTVNCWFAEIKQVRRASPADGVVVPLDAHAIAKDASERVYKNGGCVPQLAYAPILWAIEDALAASPALAATSVGEDDESALWRDHDRRHAVAPAGGGLVREAEWRDAITLILPLAKGYAAANRVGSNQSYVDYVESLLATPPSADADKLLSSNPVDDNGVDDTADKLRIALAEAADAVSFFDRVKAAPEDERIAVGHDHWDRMEAALRSLARLSTTEAGG